VIEILWGDPQALATWLGGHGAHRVLVLCGPNRRHVDAFTGALAPFTPTIFDGARVHVPAEVVDQAAAALGDADTIVAIGGGSPIGLGKALKRTHPLRFAAVPTTYAGSEMTTMYGITRDGAKTTGRDDRVRPDVVLYDAALTVTMPIALTIQSLFNALAHCVSVLSTGSLAGDDRTDAVATAGALTRVMDDLLRDPTDLAARTAALRAASAAGVAADRGKPGAQHRLAHRLGGALDLDHAALHAVLLPRFVDHLRATQPALVAELALPDLDALLARAGAPRTLDQLLPWS
jgi:maleylacetate reductase